MHVFLDTPSTRWAAGTEFWARVTGGSLSAPRGEVQQFVTLLPRYGDSWLKLQSIRDDRARVHLDLEAADPAEARRVSERAGASFAWQFEDVAVMRSPGGFLFCHTHAVPGRAPQMARSESAIVDQVCLDIPPRLWEAEVRFWRQLTQRTLERGAHSEFSFLGDPDPAGPPRILLQRLTVDAPEVTAHVDIATNRRAEDTRRHEDLGADVVRVDDDWTVLVAPSGHVYCLTDRDSRTGSVHVGEGS